MCIGSVFSSDLFLCVLVIATLGGAAIFTEVLKNISLCNEVLPLCFTLVTMNVYCLLFCFYSARKMPVGDAAITTLHYKSDKMSHYITCSSAISFSRSIVV